MIIARLHFYVTGGTSTKSTTRMLDGNIIPNRNIQNAFSWLGFEAQIHR
jgi:hypothetical protein